MKEFFRKLIRKTGYDLKRFGHGSDALFDIASELPHSAPLVIFDVGAHHGQTATQFAKMFPSAKIYCFEPHPDSYRQLKENASKYSTAVLENIGLSDVGGIQQFHCNAGSPTNSLLQLSDTASQIWSNDLLRATNTVSCLFKTLDDYVALNHITHIDLLKIDVQGAEIRVIKGAAKAIRDNKIKFIYLEVIVGSTYVGQNPLWEYFKLMDSLGYTLLGMYNMVHQRDRGDLLQFDVLYCLNDNSNFLNEDMQGEC